MGYVIQDRSKLWGCAVPVEFGGNIRAGSQRGIVWTAMKRWNAAGLIQFYEYTGQEQDWIRILSVSTHSSSDTGRQGGCQDLKINFEGVVGASVVGVVMHEMGHAIGLKHEHQRPDAYRFIRIVIGTNRRRSICSSNLCTDFLDTGDVIGCYDLWSIMHYIEGQQGVNALTTNERAAVIADRHSGFRSCLRQRMVVRSHGPNTVPVLNGQVTARLSRGDIETVRILYRHVLAESTC